MSKLFLIVYLLFSASAYGAISEVAAQRTTGRSDFGSSLDIAFPLNVTAGNLLCVGGSFNGGTTGLTVTISDTRSTSFSTYLYNGNDATNTYVYIACGKVAASAADTITITPSASAYIDAAIAEFSGQDPAQFLDVDGGGATNTFNVSAPTIDITTGSDNALVLAAMTHPAPTDTLTEAATWTLVGEQEDNSCCSVFSFIFKVVGGAGLQTPNWTTPINTSYSWYAYAISIKAAGPPAVAVRHKAIVIQ